MGGSILATDALERYKKKHRTAADKKLQKTRKAITIVENKAKKELYKRGV